LNFRRFAETYKEQYKQAPKVYKPVVAAEVVAAWWNQNPPGRFLARTDSSTSDSLWYDVGDDHAIKRATKTLGERSQRERRAQKTNKMKMGVTKNNAPLPRLQAHAQCTACLTMKS
jgi:hypothetical protein